MDMAAFYGATLFLAAVVFITAAVNDARYYAIPNTASIFLLVLFPLFVVTSPHPVDWVQNLIVFGIVAIAGFAAFMAELTGAGDIKLLAVASLWAGPDMIDVLLITTALVGGIEALVILAFLYARRRKSAEATPLTKAPIPYGVAIAIGGLSALGMLAQPILLPK